MHRSSLKRNIWVYLERWAVKCKMGIKIILIIQICQLSTNHYKIVVMVPQKIHLSCNCKNRIPSLPKAPMILDNLLYSGFPRLTTSSHCDTLKDHILEAKWRMYLMILMWYRHNFQGKSISHRYHVFQTLTWDMHFNKLTVQLRHLLLAIGSKTWWLSKLFKIIWMSYRTYKTEMFNIQVLTK